MSARTQEPATLLIESQSGFEPVALTGTATIGRDRKCDIVIDHPTASRMHARIWPDETGWHYQDMGSQNGTKLGESKLQAPISLSDGTALRIGRVQAYFFRGPVPDSWRPPSEAGRAGKLLRCRCGHIGWAPQYTAGMTLRCAKCGRDLVHNDAGPTRVAVDCAACHTTIEPHERMYVCEECGAQLHFSCHLELGGCATYGCSKVKHDQSDQDAAGQSDTADVASSEPDFAFRAAPTPTGAHDADSIRYRLAQCGLVVLLGLPTFGVPAIAYAAYRLVNGDAKIGPLRFVYALIAFLGGAAGFVLSAYWWLGGPRPWRLL